MSEPLIEPLIYDLHYGRNPRANNFLMSSSSYCDLFGEPSEELLMQFLDEIDWSERMVGGTFSIQSSDAEGENSDRLVFSCEDHSTNCEILHDRNRIRYDLFLGEVKKNQKMPILYTSEYIDCRLFNERDRVLNYFEPNVEDIKEVLNNIFVNFESIYPRRYTIWTVNGHVSFTIEAEGQHGELRSIDIISHVIQDIKKYGTIQ